MKKKIKKAFTLVELLVVIAILAILATVSIVGYNSFTKKAKVSNDTALVSQLNTVLKADSMVNGNVSTPTDALKVTEEAGYDVEKLTPTASNYEIIWNQEVNQFALLDENDNVVYGEKNTDEYKNWKFVSTYDADSKYSMYLKDNVTTTSIDNLKVGLDVGTNTAITAVNYIKDENAKDDVRIRTNGGTLNVNADTDTISHYASIDKVVITAVANNSYHEYGNVNGNVEIKSGRVVVEKNAEIENVLVTGNDVKIFFEDKETTTNIIVTDNVDEDKMPTVDGANVGTTNYKLIKTYDELVSSFASNSSLILGANIDVLSPITLSENVNIEINLNGYSLNANCLLFAVFGTLTIDGNGKLYSSNEVINVNNNGFLTINGANIISSKSGGIYLGRSCNETSGGTLVFNKGSIHAREAALYSFEKGNIVVNDGKFTSLDNFVIGTNGNGEYGHNFITLNGGVFNASIITSGYIACGIYLANDDTLSVNGGTFNITNGVGIVIRGGTVTIKNIVVNLNNDGEITNGKVGDSLARINTSAQIVVDKYSQYPAYETINVTADGYHLVDANGNSVDSKGNRIIDGNN